MFKDTDVADVTSNGRLFNMGAAATAKALLGIAGHSTRLLARTQLGCRSFDVTIPQV